MGKKRKQSVENVNEHKRDILMRYKDIIDSQNRSLVNQSTGAEIWKLWQEYTGRTAPYRNCSACLFSKVKYLNNELKKLPEDDGTSL